MPASALSALDAGDPSPPDLRRDLVGQHRLSDETWTDASKLGDEQTLVELLALVGYGGSRLARYVAACRSPEWIRCTMMPTAALEAWRVQLGMVSDRSISIRPNAP